MDKIPSSLIFTLPVKQHFASACFLHLGTALESVRGQGSETSSNLCAVRYAPPSAVIQARSGQLPGGSGTAPSLSAAARASTAGLGREGQVCAAHKAQGVYSLAV